MFHSSQILTVFQDSMGKELQWGGGITGHLLFTPVMTHKSEVYKFYIFEMNILTELVYLIIFCLFLLFKPY